MHVQRLKQSGHHRITAKYTCKQKGKRSLFNTHEAVEKVIKGIYANNMVRTKGNYWNSVRTKRFRLMVMYVELFQIIIAMVCEGQANCPWILCTKGICRPTCMSADTRSLSHRRLADTRPIPHRHAADTPPTLGEYSTVT